MIIKIIQRACDYKNNTTGTGSVTIGIKQWGVIQLKLYNSIKCYNADDFILQCMRKIKK